MYRKTYAEINLDNLILNIKQIKDAYSDYEYYFGIVKANAYGHGLEIVESLIEAGINYLAAATLDECLAVRKINKDIPILCLEPVHLDELEVCIINKITVTVTSLDYYRKMKELNLKDKIKIHIKLDTGMNRLGIKYQDHLEEIVNDIKNQSNIILEGIYTHLSTSGINDNILANQLSCFEYLTDNINLKEIPIIHIGRSATLTQQKKISYCNGIRLGIIMYGFNQNIIAKKGIKKYLKKIYNLIFVKKNTLTNRSLFLNPIFSLYSEIIEMKKVNQGEFVGYGTSYKAKKNIQVGIIAIGHGDGIDKTAEGHVLINDQKYPLIGIPSMDMLFVLIDDKVKLYDKVTLIGNGISAKEVCHYLYTSPYILFNKITKRVPRIYIKNGKEVIGDKNEF